MYGILAQQCKIRICVVFSNTLIKELFILIQNIDRKRERERE